MKERTEGLKHIMAALRRFFGRSVPEAETKNSAKRAPPRRNADMLPVRLPMNFHYLF